MGSLQDVFRKRVQRDQVPDKDISVRRLWVTTNMRGGHANAAEFEMQQKQAEALANLATATAADRQAVAEISISNAKLTHELRT